MTDRTRLLVLQIAIILGICIFLFFFALGTFGLVGADEPRYAQIGREMFARHDWIVPTLNGKPWLEKPVLLYWKEMGSYMFFGVHDWAARLPAASHATALVLVVFFFMRRFRSGSELDAAVITASSAGVIGFARGASTDMLLTATFSMAMLAWWIWHENGRKAWLAAFYALLAVAALAKGPVAPALAVLIVGGYAALRRDGKVFLRSLWLPGFAIFAAIVLPWFVAIQIKVPEFFRVFFLEHNLQRFGTNLYQHAQPFWYYIPVFILGTLPWTVFALPALWDTIRRGILRARAKADGDQDDWLTLFLLIWILVPILFFSISRSKLPGYILPAIPASALLTAIHLQSTQKISRIKLMLHSLLCGVLMAGALLAPWLLVKEPVPNITREWIAGTVGIIAVLVLLIVRRSGPGALRFATLIPVALAMVFLLRFAGPLLDQTLSARAVSRAVDIQSLAQGVIDPPVALFDVKKQRELAYGLNFYRNRPITYYESEGPRDVAHGVPAETHVVITKTGNRDAVQAVVGQRSVRSVGSFEPQHLEFFLVGDAR